MIKLIATDLDRTLLPNGDQPYDGSMPLFARILRDYDITLAFVSGRSLDLIKDAIEKYKTPTPNYVISDVGTTIYEYKNEGFMRDNSWDIFIKANTKGWDTECFKKSIKKQNISFLTLQEEKKQNIFKLSYYISSTSNFENIKNQIEKAIKSDCGCHDFTLVFSIDETKGQGLLDILPKKATKEMAIEHVRKKIGITKDEVLYCGDSGNDILPLTNGYWSVVVRNAIDDVKNKTIKIAMQKNILNKLWIAKGYKNLNGYYVSGIIEGLVHFGFVDEDYLEN